MGTGEVAEKTREVLKDLECYATQSSPGVWIGTQQDPRTMVCCYFFSILVQEKNALITKVYLWAILEMSSFSFSPPHPLLFRAASASHGSFQARDQIGVTTAGLLHNHSNMESEPHLRPAPQLMATLDP